MRILHLSDLHFGVLTKKKGKKTTQQCMHLFSNGDVPNPDGLLQVLTADQAITDPPDAIVISGDVGWSGIADDYVHAKTFIGGLRALWPHAALSVIPGNHDVDRKKSKDDAQDAFVAFLHEVYPDEKYFRTADGKLSKREQLASVQTFTASDGQVGAIVSANSAAHLAGDDGTPVHIRNEVLTTLKSLLSEVPAGAFRIFALHHHLLPFAEPNWKATISAPSVPNEADPTIVANSAHLQTWLTKNAFHLVLHGHKHQTHGRADRLWRPTEPEARLVIAGAGSASVESGHVKEPHSYGIIDAHRLSEHRWNLDVAVRQISQNIQPPEAKDLHDYQVDAGPDPIEPPLLVQCDRSDHCHAAIRRAARGQSPIRNFLSIITDPNYHHPKTAELEGRAVAEEEIVRSFHALHPEYELTEKWGTLDHLETSLRDSSPRFQFKHGPRLFALPKGAGPSEHRPILSALDRLKEGKSKGYVSLFSPTVDVEPPRNEPLPALMGLQFVPVGETELDVVATFRTLELSFWWAVNTYEVARILKWAADRTGRKGRRIIFYSAMAEWKTTDAAAAFVALLDSRKLPDIVEIVDAVLRDDVPKAEALAELLTEKAQHTNSQNLDVTGLDRLTSVLVGLLQRPGVNQKWWELEESVRTARDLLRAAIDKGPEDTANVTKARELLTKAAAFLAPPGPAPGALG